MIWSHQRPLSAHKCSVQSNHSKKTFPKQAEINLCHRKTPFYVINNLLRFSNILINLFTTNSASLSRKFCVQKSNTSLILNKLHNWLADFLKNCNLFISWINSCLKKYRIKVSFQTKQTKHENTYSYSNIFMTSTDSFMANLIFSSELTWLLDRKTLIFSYDLATSCMLITHIFIILFFI